MKTMLRWMIVITLAGAFVGCSKTPSATAVSFEDLVGGLADLGHLARLDSPSCRIVTSFDRKGGNDDFNNELRKGPEGWIVLADLKGPGYVSRFWSTTSDNRRPRIRFYFDGERTPRIDTTYDEFLGGTAPFQSPLAAYEPWAWYTFLPLPYKKRLVIMVTETGDKPGSAPKTYFQINYCPLKPGELRESYPVSPGGEQLAAVEAARKRLADLETGKVAMPEGGQVTDGLVVASGAAGSFELPAGPKLLREIRIQPDFGKDCTAAARALAMRNIFLKIYWNGNSQPSVEVPLGDFFGSVWQQRRFQSAYFGCSNNTFYTRFPMPYEKGARIELVNLMPFPVSFTVSATAVPLASWNSDLGYFHSGWMKTGPGDVGQPHNVLQASGRGRYVGMMLSVASLDKSWWILEGDESIRLDNEPFPSWHGTGLEDYFNAGWYYGNALVRPFHGVLFIAPFRTIQYRVHQTDPVNFQSAVSVQFERGPDHASHGWMESVSFYYLDAPARACSMLGDSALRQVPDDGMGPATVMMEINNLERLGDYRGVSDYLESFLEKTPGYPYAQILQLRRLANAEKEKGFEALRPDLDRIMETASTNALVKKQVEDWLWYREGSSNALLGIYCNMRARAFLDGAYIGDSGDPERMQVYRVSLKPGRHALAIQAANREYPRWVQACLRTHQGDIYTSPKWKFALSPQGSWSSPEYDDRGWEAIGGPDQGKGPPEVPWVWLEPHLFPDMQAKARGLWPGKEWADRNAFVVFRTVFEVP